KTAGAPLRRGDGHANDSASTSTTANRPGRRHTTATFPRSGPGLVTLRRPRIDEQAVVETVDDEASGVTQDHGAGGAGEQRPAEPLVGRWSALVARCGHAGVPHDGVNRVVLGQRAIERDAGAERLNGLVARVHEPRLRLEADSRSAHAER